MTTEDELKSMVAKRYFDIGVNRARYPKSLKKVCAQLDIMYIEVKK